MPSIRRAALPIALALLNSIGPPAPAQSLGEAARKERERRRSTAEKTGKVYTNEDLEEARAPDSPGEGGRLPAPEASPEPSPEPEEDRSALERRWRERFARARERLQEADRRAWRTVIRTEFVAGIPVPMRVREHVETEELRRARQDLEDLEDELRRAGLPAGWGRE